MNEDPVFILGYYRSGTTYLQEVLLRDQRFGYLNFYQCYFSNAFLLTEKWFKKLFGKIMTAVGFHHPAHRVPFLFDMPGEEDVAMVASGYRYAACWGQLFQKNFKEIFGKFVFNIGVTEAERIDFEQEYQLFVQKVSLANQGKKLLLKSPPSTARISMLKRLYPQAKFIFIHRDLMSVYKSNQKLWQSFERHRLHTLPSRHASEMIAWSMNLTFEAYESQKKQLQTHELYEIAYEEFMKNPLQHLQNIYDQFGWSEYEKHLPAFKEFISQKHGSNVDRHVVSEEDKNFVNENLSRWKNSFNS